MATSRETCEVNYDAVVASNDARAAKRQRLSNVASSSRAIGCVFDVEMLVRGLLPMLDLASLASFLEVLAVNETWRQVLTHETLWNELLRVYFAGNLPPVEQFNDENEVEEEEEESEEEEEEDEEEEEEEEEEDNNDNEHDLLELLEGDMEIDDNASLLEEDIQNEDEEEVDERLVPSSHFRTGQSTTAAGQGKDMATRNDDATVQVAPVLWLAGVPSRKLLDAACPALKEFLHSAEQLVQFDAHVQIIRGDIGDIAMVERQPVDGLAFPTAAFLRNPHSGAASVIFRRAGQGLSEHVRTLNVRLEVGQVHVTPGFDAGVAKLIHCVGPSGSNPHCSRDLQRTYRSVLRCIQTENLRCVAMASISTGNMGMPADKAAWFALCAIQRYIRSTDWTATIAIVCFEADVYAAFARSKAKLLARFNEEDARVTPPLRNW